MKLTRRAVLRLTGTAAAALALSGCSASGSAILGSNFSAWLQQTFGVSSSGAASSAASSEAMAASPLPTGEQPAASLAALPAYDADPLTGEAKRSNGRIVGVMVNNISNTTRQNARPQRGLSSADLLIECKVEGGITRFCAVFHDADSIPEIGPLRSGRDQFLQLLMPYQALYYHDGESAACTKFISVYNYSGLNIGGKSYFNTPTHPHVAHRDSRGRNVAYEHTEFTSGAEIRKAAANAGISLKYDYDTTFFRFADYRTKEENAMKDAAVGKTVHIVHSDHYKTTFTYSLLSHSYKMQMYSRAAGSFQNTVDELTGKQLSFDNLLVCFAGIADYPGNSGGALFNLYGEVIGIVSAKYSSYSDTTVEGLGFAIPINDVQAIITDIIENGQVTGKAYLAIKAGTMTEQMAAQYNIGINEGVFVYSTESGGAGERAGLQLGDVITKVNDTAITSMTDLSAAKKNYKAGDTVTLTVYRNGEYITLDLTFDEQPQTTGEDTATDNQQDNQQQGSQDYSDMFRDFYNYYFGRNGR